MRSLQRSGNTVHTRHRTAVQNPAPTCDHFKKHSSHALSYACTEPRAHMASALATVGAPTVASHTAAPLGSRTPRSAIRPPHTPAAPFGSHTAQQPKSASKQQGRTHHVAEPGCTSSSSRGEIWMSVTVPCTSQFTSSYKVLRVEDARKLSAIDGQDERVRRA